MERTHYDLVAELLDQQLLDFIGRPLGKVDGVVLELREGEAPRVTHLALGGVTLPRRLRAPLGRWLEAAARRWGARRGEPFRIPWSSVKKVGLEVEVNVDADQSPALYWEHRLGALVRRIPGS